MRGPLATIRLALFTALGPAILLVVAGCGGSSVSARPTATPLPATAAPLATQLPTGTPAAPVPTATLAPVGTGRTLPPSTGSDETTDAATVRAKGYDPALRVAQTPDGSGNTLYAFHGTCAGSADGYCQIMLFFIGTRYLGTDTKDPSTAIVNYQASATGSIDVTYAHYAKSDPFCCPSLQPVTISYHWNGTHLIPSGTPPGH